MTQTLICEAQKFYVGRYNCRKCKKNSTFHFLYEGRGEIGTWGCQTILTKLIRSRTFAKWFEVSNQWCCSTCGGGLNPRPQLSVRQGLAQTNIILKMRIYGGGIALFALLIQLLWVRFTTFLNISLTENFLKVAEIHQRHALLVLIKWTLQSLKTLTGSIYYYKNANI